MYAKRSRFWGWSLGDLPPSCEEDSKTLSSYPRQIISHIEGGGVLTVCVLQMDTHGEDTTSKTVKMTK